jgi:hypothetical protein
MAIKMSYVVLLLFDVPRVWQESGNPDRGRSDAGYDYSRNIVLYCIVFTEGKQAGFNSGPEKMISPLSRQHSIERTWFRVYIKNNRTTYPPGD